MALTNKTYIDSFEYTNEFNEKNINGILMYIQI